jgi:hypothetical protein
MNKGCRCEVRLAYLGDREKCKKEEVKEEKVSSESDAPLEMYKWVFIKDFVEINIVSNNMKSCPKEEKKKRQQMEYFGGKRDIKISFKYFSDAKDDGQDGNIYHMSGCFCDGKCNAETLAGAPKQRGKRVTVEKAKEE